MKNKMKNILIAFTAGMVGAFVFSYFYRTENKVYIERANTPEVTKHTALKADGAISLNEGFVLASKESTPAVVYIKTLSTGNSSWFEQFFYGNNSQRVSSGSGVIYQSDGYIITNNHVIEGSENIQVIVGKISYDAKVIGADPSSDLAVLKIEGDNLTSIKIGSSRALEVGEWVLAVGNPFNLTSTVTAGIVSAKGRDIDIVNDRFPIESFIQTDAAINPGNSGGALVNLKGELVGVNTAIYSKTGSYAGYGFAVPVDVVVKITKDLIKYGEVQKAFLGAEVSDLSSKLAESIKMNGVVIQEITPDGAANKAGLNEGDIILKINGYNIDSKAIFNEELSYRSPGEEIIVQYLRDKKEKETKITLTNWEGTTSIIKRNIYKSATLGADLENVSKVEKKKLKIDEGVKVLRVYGGLLNRLGLKPGFIITHINNRTITSPQELEELLTKIRGRVTIQGITENGGSGYYSFFF